MNETNSGKEGCSLKMLKDWRPALFYLDLEHVIS